MSPKIVGLYAPAPQSGKTTVATYLRAYGYDRLSFADPIKEMAAVLLENLGYTESEALHLVYNAKTTQIPDLRTNIRHILQVLGTEFGRDCIHPDLWLICWRRRAERAIATGRKVICDDVRFENEADLIRSMGGEMWCIRRPNTTSTETHSSEGSLNSYPHFAHSIRNNGTLSELYAAASARLLAHPDFDPTCLVLS